MRTRKHQGQNLIEAIIAIAIFGVLISGGVVSGLNYFDLQIRAQQQTKLAQVALSSFEILEGLTKNSWDSLATGTYGLILNNGNWELSPTPDNLDDLTRTLNIADGLRDTSCNLVPVGGEPDSDTKQVTLNLAYTDNRGPQTNSFTRYFTRWPNPNNCVIINEASSLDLDVSMAFIDTTKKSLFGIRLTNNSSKIITLDKMVFTWDTPGNITYIKIAGTNYWHATNGIGTPQGAQPSGTELDLVNFTLQPHSSYEVDNVRFDSKVDGATFTITATMLDNSSKTEITSPPFIP